MLVYKLIYKLIYRYIAIIYPLGSSRFTKSLGPVIVAIIWILGLMLGFVIWYNSAAVPFQFGNETYYECKESWSEESGKMYTSVIFVITFALPMLILTYVYGSVAWKMLRHSAPGNADPARDEAQQQAKIKVLKAYQILLL